MTRAPLLALLAALAIGLAAGAAAHGRSTSTSAWEIQEGPRPSARILVRMAWADLQMALPEISGLTPQQVTASAELSARLDAYLTGHYRLRAGDTPCPPRGPVAALPTSDPTHVARRFTVVCPEAGPLVMRADGFTDVAPSHLHLARVRRGGGPAVERVFVLAAPELALDADDAPPAASSVVEFVRLGIEHIATGYDHLVFLLALLLVGVSPVEVATVVTGFTVAHSVTLALGVLGLVRPEAAAVEALIGLSIAVVALENAALLASARLRRALLAALAVFFAAALAGSAAGLLRVPPLALGGIGLFALCYFGLLEHVARPFRLRWLLAFVFGLVHGLGFAGVLGEMELPRARLAHALFGFNAGVEIGQLAIVALAWPVLAAVLRGTAERRRLVVQAGSAGVLAAGLYWFVSRAAIGLALVLALAAPARADAAGDEAAVLAREESRRQALVSGDAARLAEILHARAVVTHANGERESKAEHLAGLGSKYRYEKISTGDLRVRLHGDSAVVTGESRLDLRVGAEARRVRVRFTELWVRDTGAWRLAAYQSTPVPTASESPP